MFIKSVMNAVLMIVSILFITSAASAQGATTVNWNERGENEIAPGYLIRLRCVDDEEVNGDFRVDFDGNLKLPYGVGINTTGLTLRDLNGRLVGEYRKFFKTTPSIQASVAEKRYWVDVRGLVQKAGKYLVTEKSSLDEIIAKAGALRAGQGEGPSAKFVKIDQLGVSATLKLSDYYRGASESLVPNWQGGEVVFFQSDGILGTPVSAVAEDTIQLLGQVTIPGEYRIKSGADFLYYLVKAGGPTERADVENFEIIRVVNAQPTSIKFDLEDVESLPDLQGGDIVISHPYRESRVITNFTSIITAITSIVLVFLV